MPATDHTLTVDGPAVPVATCLRRLAAAGVTGASARVVGGAPAAPIVRAERPLRPGSGDVGCSVSWWGSADVPAGGGSEALVQARAGLMHMHGLEQGRPRRLGLDVASTAAGLLAAQAVLAELVAGPGNRGGAVAATSVFDAGLLLVSQYVARATCAARWADWVSAPEDAGAGPPFPTKDGRWVEIEALSPEPWRAFWSSLGVAEPVVARSWRPFLSRYSTATCPLPVALHEATAERTLAELVTAATLSGMSLAEVRSYDDLVADGAGAHLALPRLSLLGGAAPTLTAAAPGALPLAGLHVVEVTSRIQGPLAGRLLQLLGATVTRVEPPGGDGARMVEPLAGDTGAVFLCFNRGKAPVELDLRVPGDRAALGDLVAEADVFLHNWRPGRAAAWGLDADRLAARRPGLVYVHASGWGPGDDAPDLIGTDYLVQAHTAVGDGLRPAGEPPFPSRVLVVDVLGAMVAAEGALVGLYRRRLGGRGCAVDTSLRAGAMTLQAPVVEAIAAGREGGRRAGRPVWGPLDRPLDTADGFLAVELSDGAADPPDERLARLHERSARDWEDDFAGSDVGAVAVTTDLRVLAADPRFAALFVPLGGAGRVPASPWRFGP